MNLPESSFDFRFDCPVHGRVTIDPTAVSIRVTPDGVIARTVCPDTPHRLVLRRLHPMHVALLRKHGAGLVDECAMHRQMAVITTTPDAAEAALLELDDDEGLAVWATVQYSAAILAADTAEEINRLRAANVAFQARVRARSGL